MAEQRLDQTKEFFSKFILGQKSVPQVAKSVPKYKIPKIRSEEGSQTAARTGKRSLSGSGSSQDSGHAPDNEILWGENRRVTD